MSFYYFLQKLRRRRSYIKNIHDDIVAYICIKLYYDYNYESYIIYDEITINIYGCEQNKKKISKSYWW